MRAHGVRSRITNSLTDVFGFLKQKALGAFIGKKIKLCFKAIKVFVCLSVYFCEPEL